MKGSKDIHDKFKEYLDLVDSGASPHEMLSMRLSILERVVYYLLQRQRDELVYVRRSANNFDRDAAELQSFVRSLLMNGRGEGDRATHSSPAGEIRPPS